MERCFGNTPAAGNSTAFVDPVQDNRGQAGKRYQCQIASENDQRRDGLRDHSGYFVSRYALANIFTAKSKSS